MTFLNKFFPDDIADTSSQHSLRSQTQHPPDTNDEPPFTQNEILTILKNMNPTKSPGADNLTSDIIYHFTLSLPHIITDLMNRCLFLSIFPKSWKHAIVKIIPKPNKTDYSKLSSFRPIGLLPILGKTLEKLVTQRLTHHLNITHTSNTRQFGFKQQTSTIHALKNITDTITQHKRNGLHVAMISLDIKAAFDNAWWPSILARLHHTRCPKNIYTIIQNYLTHRTASIYYSDTRATKTLTRGCVQGSVCGPAFWNLILDELLDMSSDSPGGGRLPEGCLLRAFADDITLVASHSKLTTLQDNINTSLQTIFQWGNRAKLTFAPEKTVALAFTRKTKMLHIQMNNTHIAFSRSARVLGVIIDDNLRFTQHIDYITTKARTLHNKLATFVRPTWGLHSQNVHTLYRGVIEPIICYASSIWHNALEHKTNRNKLLSTQRGFALKIIKGFKTINTTNAIAISTLTPIDIKIKESALIETTKITGLTDYLPGDITLDTPTHPSNLIHPANRTPHTFDTINTQTELDAALTNLLHAHHIYTDGSKHDGSVGAAFVIHTPQNTIITKSHKLHSSCTVFQAELVAIDQACRWLAEQTQVTAAVILSDSRSALEDIQNVYSTHQITTFIQKFLSTTHIHIKLMWVKAHAGISGNEVADIAAKVAATTQVKPTFAHFPLSYIKKVAKDNSCDMAAAVYNSNTKGTIIKTWCPTLPQLHKLIATTGHTFALTQLLTGHGYHKQYLHRFHIINSDTCPCDNTTIQTLTHLITQCPRYTRTRLTHEQYCHLKQLSPYDLDTIINNNTATDTFMTHLTHIIETLKKFNNT